jgi:hypothetical protein
MSAREAATWRQRPARVTGFSPEVADKTDTLPLATSSVGTSQRQSPAFERGFLVSRYRHQGVLRACYRRLESILARWLWVTNRHSVAQTIEPHGLGRTPPATLAF